MHWTYISTDEALFHFLPWVMQFNQSVRKICIQNKDFKKSDISPNMYMCIQHCCLFMELFWNLTLPNDNISTNKQSRKRPIVQPPINYLNCLQFKLWHFNTRNARNQEKQFAAY